MGSDQYFLPGAAPVTLIRITLQIVIQWLRRVKTILNVELTGHCDITLNPNDCWVSVEMIMYLL